MKKLLFSLSAVVAGAGANATIITITCQNTPAHFLPVTVNAMCGDTIMWSWVAGTHVVGPVSPGDIPVGAAMWNAPIDFNNTAYGYVVTVPGNYHYVCHPSTPHGEDGYIVVTCSSSVPQINSVSNVSFAYPNPFSDKVVIETIPADKILIYNLLGEEIRSISLSSVQTKIEIDLSTLPKGIFFYSIVKDNAILETRKIIKVN